MRKRVVGLLIAAALLVAVSVGTTTALLFSSSSVSNTFTVGSVTITLQESTGRAYMLAPGVTVAKDPTVTVAGNSDACWLFVQVEKAHDFDTFCTYAMADGWTPLAGQEGVYYRTVEKRAANQPFAVLQDNAIHVKDTVTEEQLNALTHHPTLTVTAYAAQSEGLATAADAWQALREGRGG